VAQKSLDDIMYDEECKRYALAFDQANQVAMFYAYMKLKEQVKDKIILGSSKYNLACRNDLKTFTKEPSRLAKNHCAI
jgi:hypothetical protein